MPDSPPPRNPATLPLLQPSRAGNPYGYMDPEEWRTFAGWMRDNGLIKSLPEPGEGAS